MPPKAAATDSAKKKEQDAQQKKAQAELDMLLNKNRPRGFGEGVSSGVGNIVGGMLGGVGVLVILPVAGASAGAKQGGLLGGILGLGSGALVGAIAGPVVMVAGFGQGFVQMGRGVAAVPKQISEPKKGNWWNEAEGKWCSTNLDEEAEAVKKYPANDDDILGEARKEAEEGTGENTATEGEVADTYYYDLLEVPHDAEVGKIKKQYYKKARQYHPDKVGADDKEAADKFKEIAEAYQVLSDPQLRKKYDTDGRDGLSADKTDVVGGDNPNIDPALLFAFLFGSDKFDPYVGRLAMATSAIVGDSDKISVEDLRKLQQRRCAKLALKLAERLQVWTSEDYETAKTAWKAEAEELSKASFGSQLVHTIGEIYVIAALQFLGTRDSGVGMPSISKWAAAKRANMDKKNKKTKNQMDQLKAGLAVLQLQEKAKKEIEAAKTDEEKKAIEEKLMKDSMEHILKVMWTTTVVDMTVTIHETVQMVLFDKSVDKETRKKRANGIKNLGEIFAACPVPPKAEGEADKDAAKLYEEAAFAAMLETIKRKDEAAYEARGGETY